MTLNIYDFENIWIWNIYFGNEDRFQMFWMKMIFKAVSRTENPSGFWNWFRKILRKNTIFESICEYYFEMIWHFGNEKFWCMLSMTDNSIAKRMDCEMSYPCEVLLIFSTLWKIVSWCICSGGGIVSICLFL